MGGSLIRPRPPVWLRVLRDEMLKSKKDKLEGKSAWSRAAATSRNTPSRSCLISARSRSACPTPTAPSTMRRHRPRQARVCHGSEEQPPRPHQGVRRQIQEGHLQRHDKSSTTTGCGHQGDCAFPSATQNEINAKDAANLIKNGVKVVSEGANMPSTSKPPKRSSTPNPLRTGQGRNAAALPPLT